MGINEVFLWQEGYGGPYIAHLSTTGHNDPIKCQMKLRER